MDTVRARGGVHCRFVETFLNRPLPPFRAARGSLWGSFQSRRSGVWLRRISFAAAPDLTRFGPGQDRSPHTGPEPTPMTGVPSTVLFASARGFEPRGVASSGRVGSKRRAHRTSAEGRCGWPPWINRLRRFPRRSPLRPSRHRMGPLAHAGTR
jgi:hypothetical protein